MAKRKPIDVYAGMVDLAHQRGESRTIDVLDCLPMPPADDVVYCGMASQYWRNARRGVLTKKSAIVWQEVPHSAGQLARDYIKVKYAKKLPLKARHQQILSWGDRLGFAYLAKPGWLENAVYLDVKSAYWSILQAVGWDVDYETGLYLIKRSSVDDCPVADIKPVRASLISTGVMDGVTVSNYGKMEEIKGNVFYRNNALWQVAQSILHVCAAYARECGAVYFHTDGAILPRSRADEYIEKVGRLGLRLGEKGSGIAHIQGVGAYRIGNNRSGLYGTMGDHPAVNIADIDGNWWVRNFSGLARVHIRD